jgi:transposase
MHVVHPVCGGMEGPPAPLSAGRRRVRDAGPLHPAWRDFGPPSAQRLARRAWLDAQRGPLGGLESPGGYWNPRSHGLVQPLAVVGAQARAVRQRPGQQTAKAEAAGRAARFAPGWVAPRVLPPPAVPAWRALLRPRGALGPPRPQGPHRLRMVWEETHLTGAQAMAALLGPRGRRRRTAGCAGERHPQQRAAFALGPCRRQVPALAGAWTGQCPAPQGRLSHGDLALLALLARQLAALDAQRRPATALLAPPLEPLPSLPGITAITARDLIAERGAEMSRCGAARRVSSGAGGSPGHHARAG